ncbi:hypothetical protein [Actinoplanes rectilineatus]|uniref:hypothetical protein n=1 Tax=Actinoplanes rectilineatus TaxID=113571 RepID=UPI0005F2884D|nr:hypothetical protein [Actinoplanes rectilineatus]
MRLTTAGTALAVISLTLGGCGALGLDTHDPGTATGTPRPGGQWIDVRNGTAPLASATPMTGPSWRESPYPTLSLPAPSPGCTKTFTRTEEVLIPIEVTPGAGSLKVEWPRQYDSAYRVVAVPQQLVSGAQPVPPWQSVPATTACTVSTTITGLVPGAPYIVWLDAPGTGYEVDGTRHLYTGRSGIVTPS